MASLGLPFTLTIYALLVLREPLQALSAGGSSLGFGLAASALVGVFGAAGIRLANRALDRLDGLRVEATPSPETGPLPGRTITDPDPEPLRATLTAPLTGDSPTPPIVTGGQGRAARLRRMGLGLLGIAVGLPVTLAVGLAPLAIAAPFWNGHGWIREFVLPLVIPQTLVVGGWLGLRMGVGLLTRIADRADVEAVTGLRSGRAPRDPLLRATRLLVENAYRRQANTGALTDAAPPSGRGNR